MRLSPGGAARRVTSTGDWDTNPVIAPSDKYLVFLRATGSGRRPTSVGAVCFTSFGTTMLSLPVSNEGFDLTRFYGKPVFAPSKNSTAPNTDWIVLPQYWQQSANGETQTERSPARVQRPDRLDVGLVEHPVPTRRNTLPEPLEPGRLRARHSEERLEDACTRATSTRPPVSTCARRCASSSATTGRWSDALRLDGADALETPVSAEPDVVERASRPEGGVARAGRRPA